MIQIKDELLRCAMSRRYFIDTYCQIYDPALATWIPFKLWNFQADFLDLVHTHKQVIALKSRQIGFTWSLLAYALWSMLFRPIAEVLLFSRREDEAIYLLSHERLRGIYTRLPEWMRANAILIDDKKHLRLSNQSGARAFPSNAGDSYTATLAIIDEADLVPDLSALLRSVAPTVEAGGKLVMISRADKNNPASPFKTIYRGAMQKQNTYAPFFVAWHAHPKRDAAWYAKQVADYSEDDLHEQYPATEAEALSARKSDKLIASAWLDACYDPLPLLDAPDAPVISGLEVYEMPIAGGEYVIGVDPAEGKADGDDSAMSVMNAKTGTEVAHLSGKISFSILAGYVNQVAVWYNDAQVLVERNNHGHAVIMWLDEHTRLFLLQGHDDQDGWLSSARGKHILYSETTEDVKATAVTIRNRRVYDQLMSIERGSLRAPNGMHDDCADAFALCVAARRRYAATWTGVW